MGKHDTVSNAIVVYAQVGKAKANHRVELDTGFLRAKSFTLPSKIVYLGDVATHVLAHLDHPETPVFSEPPKFNEQRWSFLTQSGDLRVAVSSRSYWGFGLFNSGYLNRIELEGAPASYARLMYDLSASLSHRPWEFSHSTAATRFLSKQTGAVSLKSNEVAWKEGLEMARAVFDEQLFALEEQGKAIEKRLSQAREGNEGFNEQAMLSLDSAHYDLDIARGALADGNAPAFERALARAEAYFIEADPVGHDDTSARFEDEIPQGHVLTYDGAEDEIAFVDLTAKSEEE
ncbi:MAG: hypothetical protein DWC09_08450 [Candidatus Poseidoniales archaeon]|nr:MAG: hypothetical protein DWC09_08450 [Candidatus Poseidoniales archaeon]